MRLILSEYIRTLKERSELDAILPDLLLSMQIIPLNKTQIGPRQHGVDLPAVGLDPHDGVQKLFLFALKKGDLGRSDWDSGAQSVRQTINDILDGYLPLQVRRQDKKLPKVIVLATTGDLKQEMQLTWAGFSQDIMGRYDVDLRFWSADDLASFCEEYLLSEHLFTQEDRRDLRKAIAMAGEVDYSRQHLYRMFERKTGVAKLAESKSALYKRLMNVRFASALYSHWAQDNENSKDALISSERALLSTWRVALQSSNGKKLAKDQLKVLNLIFEDYINAGQFFVNRLSPYYQVEDGLAIGVTDNLELSVSVFEHIGLLASMGLSLIRAREGFKHPDLLSKIAKNLRLVITNNACAGSPRLDEQVIDINLAFSFLLTAGQVGFAREWLEMLINRISFAYRSGIYFPEASIEEAIHKRKQIDLGKEEFQAISWTIPCLIEWCVLLDDASLYKSAISFASKTPWLCNQRWIPSEEYSTKLFTTSAIHAHTGSSEILEFPQAMSDYQLEMARNQEEDVLVEQFRSANQECCTPNIDFIAHRHFRSMIPIARMRGVTK